MATINMELPDEIIQFVMSKIKKNNLLEML